MVLLLRELCRVTVKGFHSTISLWHELRKIAPIQGFVERVKLLLLSLWKAREMNFTRGVVPQQR